MQTLEPLPLFNQETLNFNILNVPQNTEEKTTTKTFLPTNIPTSQPKKGLREKSESTSALVNQFFPDYKAEKDITHIEKVVNSLLDQYTPEELQTVFTEIQYLCETVLEAYEKRVFKGKTLNELLNNLL